MPWKAFDGDSRHEAARIGSAVFRGRSRAVARRACASRQFGRVRGRPGAASGVTRTVRIEMVIGTERELREHAEAMRKHPGMQHDDPYMVQVAPGGTGEIVWRGGGRPLD